MLYNINHQTEADAGIGETETQETETLQNVCVWDADAEKNNELVDEKVQEDDERADEPSPALMPSF